MATSIPFKVVDAGRDLRMGLTATSMTDLVDRVRLKFDIESDIPIRIVLEQDGTEIDDNDYFITLEPDTPLMVLRDEERWTPYKSMMSLGLALEPIGQDRFLDGLIHSGEVSGGGSTPSSPVEELVWRLHQDLSLFPWLSPRELDSISKMDTEEMRKIVPDTKFLEFLQDLSERYLHDKGAKDYGSSGSSSVAGSSASGNNSPAPTSHSIVSAAQGSFLLHDPIKLIRMYSKTNSVNPHKNFHFDKDLTTSEKGGNELKTLRSQ